MQADCRGGKECHEHRCAESTHEPAHEVAVSHTTRYERMVWARRDGQLNVRKQPDQYRVELIDRSGK